MNEADFSTQVYDLLALYNWSFYHVFEQSHYARRSSKGFPDIIAIREHEPLPDFVNDSPGNAVQTLYFTFPSRVARLLVIEVKGTGGKVTPEQEIWHDLFRKAGAEVMVWWPDNPGLEAMVEALR